MRDYKFEHGQDVYVVATASPNFRPGTLGSVCGMRQFDGQNLYLLEFSDGETIEIPENFIDVGGQAADRIQLICLALVHGHGGKATWYSLDRSLNVQGISVDNLMTLIAELVQAGLITRTKGDKPGTELYAITRDGLARLEAHKKELFRKIELSILKLVGANAGKIGWYNLRMLRVEGQSVDFGDLMACIDSLKASACLEERKSPEAPTSALWITGKGQARIGGK